MQNIFRYYLPQQKLLRKILEKVFVSKKVNHHAPDKLMYSKCQIIKILENYF